MSEILTKKNKKYNNTYAKIKRFVLHGTLYVILSVVAYLLAYPFLYMIFASFRSAEEMRLFLDEVYLFPKDFSLEGYKRLFEFDPRLFSILRGFRNTMIHEASFLFVEIFMDVMIAYGFAKVNFRGRNKALLFCLIGPPVLITLMPQFTMFSELGLVGTFWPLVIPNFFGTFGVAFYLERYMKSLPNELFEAASMDGLGRFGLIWKIAFPLSMPAIVVQVVFRFIGIWNDLLAPEMYLKSVELKTLQVMLKSLSEGVAARSVASQPVLMAAATLASIPIIILYLSCQRFIMNAMAATAIKG